MNCGSGCKADPANIAANPKPEHCHWQGKDQGHETKSNHYRNDTLFAVATPVNWKDSDDCIIVPAVSNEAAKEKFPGGWKTIKPYLRIVQQTNKSFTGGAADYQTPSEAHKCTAENLSNEEGGPRKLFGCGMDRLGR